MATYAGYPPIADGPAVVLRDHTPLDPRPSQALRNHSPTGFAWGYGGSGPAQLALAILLDVAGAELALEHYQSFKREVVAGWVWEHPWAYTTAQALNWLLAFAGPDWLSERLKAHNRARDAVGALLDAFEEGEAGRVILHALARAVGDELTSKG